VFQLGDGHLTRIEELIAQYADLPMDLADASLVVLAEETGSGRIFSTDQRDFRTYRWKNRRPFRDLLLP
jgi:predicted nucleic acid-binding protein